VIKNFHPPNNYSQIKKLNHILEDNNMAWTIDTSHSQIQFSVRHMMISNVRGRFENFSGTVDLDEENPENSVVNVTIDIATLNTRDAQRDGHLRSADFFEIEKYPHMIFVSKKVKTSDSNHGKIVGDLTIRGVTKEVVLNVEFNGQAKSPWGTTSAGFTAETKINRKDWGLAWNKTLETGGVLVGEEITINIDLELVKQPETAAVA
jgi:polyisoprenoid-binding protein YceI